MIPAYVDALCREIDIISRSAPERLKAHTIFFGGGTPSLLSSMQFNKVLDMVRASFDLTPDAEISLEANPGTVTQEFCGISIPSVLTASAWEFNLYIRKNFINWNASTITLT